MRRFLAIVLLFAALPLAAQTTQIRVFELQHRPAEELIETVRPLVDPQGAVTGSGFRLIIRSTPKNLAELEAVIESLDARQRQLLISVRQGLEQQTARDEGEFSGTIEADGGNLSVGRGGTPQARLFSSRGNRDERITQQLRLVEGGWGRIAAGQAIPLREQTITTGPGGTSVQHSIQYRNADTGFEVRPRLTGDRMVTLDVRPFRAKPAGSGAIEQQSAQTRVSGQIGEWIEIGGVVESRVENRTGTLFATRERDQADSSIFVRVELTD